MRTFYALNFVVCFFVFIFASKLHNQALLTTKHIKIMAQFKVHNLIIVDASGSMTSIYEQALAGINETLSTIREEAKKATKSSSRSPCSPSPAAESLCNMPTATPLPSRHRLSPPTITRSAE